MTCFLFNRYVDSTQDILRLQFLYIAIVNISKRLLHDANAKNGTIHMQVINTPNISRNHLPRPSTLRELMATPNLETTDTNLLHIIRHITFSSHLQNYPANQADFKRLNPHRTYNPDDR